MKLRHVSALRGLSMMCLSLLAAGLIAAPTAALAADRVVVGELFSRDG